MTSGREFKKRLASGRVQVGMWACTGSPMVTEICAGAGFDWLLIDAEHAPNDLHSILAQLRATQAYPSAVAVRAPTGDPVIIKRYLDLGVVNIVIPMVESADDARELVRAVRYPPAGIRGVGAGLARVSQWGRDATYLSRADETITLIVQVESAAAVAAAAEIASVDGVDGVFIGPADLAASMGLLGQQAHPEVVAAVERCIDTVRSVGKPVGVNAFDENLARRYIERGVQFILVDADVRILARGSDSVAATYRS
jgi:4-hydroxy-2-oxoheptanedioate aldolase